MKRLHSWFASPIDRTTRRILVVVAAVTLVGWLALMVAGSPLRDEIFVPLVLLWSLMVTRLGFATRRLTERHSASLDEFEIELRNHVYFRSYQTVMAVGLLLVFVVLVAWTFGIPATALFGDDTDRALVALLTIYILLVLNLPWALLAWRFPDPVEEGERGAAGV